MFATSIFGEAVQPVRNAPGAAEVPVHDAEAVTDYVSQTTGMRRPSRACDRRVFSFNPRKASSSMSRSEMRRSGASASAASHMPTKRRRQLPV